jgi:hypothetical protein
MKKLKLIFIVTSILIFNISCNNKENKILDSIKNYKNDYYFKKNLKIDIHEIKLLELKEQSNHGDSLIDMAIKATYMETARKLSGLDVNNFFSLEPEKQIFYMDKASNDVEFIMYKKNLEKYRYNPLDTKTYKLLYEANVYEKYTITDSNGNSQNVLNENSYYLLDNDYNIILR